MIIKKGAMFGLDARIALAIFGALSVISGAALYSAIQQSKVISLVAEFNEIQKAYESYYVDVGTQPGVHATVLEVIDFRELVESTKTGWKGPYLGYNINSFNSNYEYPTSNYGTLALRAYTTIDWGVDLTDSSQISPVACNGEVNCNVFIGLHNVNIAIATAIDEYIDGASDGQKGKVRLYNPSATIKYVWIDTGISYKS